MNEEFNVVIAEDEKRICSLIKALIDWDGLHLRLVGEAHDGVQALTLLQQEKVDILITDIRMPDVNGLDLTKWVNDHCNQCSVIIISGYKQFDYAYDALRMDVVDFLLKPIKKTEINNAISKIVQKRSVSSPNTSTITISDIHTSHIHSLFMNLQPGEITYLVGKGLYEYDFLNAIFGEVPRCRINLGNKDFINAKINALFYTGIGYFPQDVSRLIFPDLNYIENTTIFSLRKISHLGIVIRSVFQNYLLTKTPFSYKEDPKHSFHKINHENRVVAMANRYALYNWRLLIIHLPNINPTGVEAKIFQTLINELANRGTSVLVVVAASSEILTRADNLFEFDQEGNCYQKLDHQNHR